MSQIFGAGNSFLDSVNFDYRGGEDCHYNIDHLAGSTAGVLYRSEDNLPRLFVNNHENYKTIAGSVVFGAFADGEGLCLKTYFLAEIINYFLEISPITALNELFANQKIDAFIYPNPFSENAQIEIILPEENTVSIIIFDDAGNRVCEIAQGKFPPGKHSFTWNGSNDKGIKVKSGVYFYCLKTFGWTRSGKLILAE